MVTYDFNPSNERQEESEVRLVYRTSTWIARTTQRNCLEGRGADEVKSI